MNKNLIYHKVSYIPPVISYSSVIFELFQYSPEYFHCLVCHIRYHHSQDEVLSKIYIFQVKHYDEYLLKMLRPIILLQFLSYWSISVLKLRFESKKTPKYFDEKI